METVIAAVISGAVTLAVCLITNHAQQEKTRALMEYQLRELTSKVEKHNNMVERTYLLEGQMRECQHDIKDLKGYHKPTSD